MSALNTKIVVGSELPITQIVNFQITPYADTVANYVNSLTEIEIYKLFTPNHTSDVLTAALYAIYELESQAYSILVQHEDINASWVLREALRLCPEMSENRSVNQLADVLTRDQLLFQNNINELALYPNVFVLTVNGMYAGHIYAWNVDMGTYRVTNVIGIRSSLIQILIDKCGLRQRGITATFINAIRSWADENNSGKDYYMRVIQPVGSVPNILKSLGFSLAKTLINMENTKWLFDNLSLGNIPLIQGLVFREYDYIIKVNDSTKKK